MLGAINILKNIIGGEEIAMLVKINKYLFVIASLLIIALVLFSRPILIGDGREYLGMTISYSNHLTPNLTEEDRIERKELEIKNNYIFDDSFEYSGYYKGLDGEYYSYHFWFYSLISLIPYVVLDLVGMNALKVFQIVNGLLVVFLLYKISRNSYLNEKGKLWMNFATIASPIVLYIPWTHTEVFSYVLLTIGLLDYLDNRKKAAIIYITVASLQNPAISLVALSILIYEIFKKRKLFDKENVILTSISTIVFIPSIFYWIYFREFNLIAATGYSSREHITLNKIVSLFFDPNFGMFIYVPLLLIISLYLIFKRDIRVIFTCLLLIIIAVICSTQLNWNSGMMYINRYSVWMMALLFIGTIHFIQSRSNKVFSIYIISFVLTTGLITSVCVKNYNGDNWLKFNSLSQTLLSNVPSIYNPVPEVFAERALGVEKDFRGDLPITLINSEGIRKSLVLSDDNQLEYLNGEVKYGSSNLGILKTFKSQEDIFVNTISASFEKGFYGLEGNSSFGYYRWIDKNAILNFVSDSLIANANLSLNISSFHKENKATIYLNDKQIFNDKITTDVITLQLNGDIKEGMNTLKIVTSSSVKPSKVDSNSSDNRELSFSISSVDIMGQKDIVKNHNVEYTFEDGWYGLEGSNITNLFRWTGKESNLKFSYIQTGKVKMTMDVASYHQNQDMKVILNELEIYNTQVTPDIQTISFEMDLKEGNNYLRIVSSGGEIPNNVDSSSTDMRELSFYISSITIE